MHHHNEKQAVALSSVFAGAALTTGKLVVGLLTGSLGILSEAAHSLLDFVAAGMTYMAVRVSDKPADEEHHYGHGKIESLSALGETLLLFATCIWIFYEAAHRLITQDFAVEVTWWSVAVIIVSIIIDISRSRALSRVAKKTKSQALEADALHFSSDVYSSGVVLLGLCFVYAGWPMGDAIAAMGVACFVFLAGWRLWRRTIDMLLDKAPPGIADKVQTLMASIPAVIKVNQLRVRPAGHLMFMDVDVNVPRCLPPDRVNATRLQIIDTIQNAFGDAEVIVSARPTALDNETAYDRVNVIAANLGMAIHHVTVYQVGEKLSVSLDQEVGGTLTLKEGHALATKLERAIRAELGENIEVETHIEPRQTAQETTQPVGPETLAAIRKFAQECAASIGFIRDVHAVRARETPKGTIIIFHCHVDPDQSVDLIHNAIDSIERCLRQKYPEACRIVGHAEPGK